jgi:hypothetical protein
MQTPSNPAIDTTHLTLVEQVKARTAELKRALTADSNSAATNADIESALAAVLPMLTGDLAKLPDAVSRELTRWLETSKYLGLHPVVGGRPPNPTHAAAGAPAGDVEDAPELVDADPVPPVAKN